MNISFLVGRITKEPELRKTQSGVSVCRLTLAVNRPFKNANGEYEADFISCILYKEIGENLSKYCHKGDLIALKGRIQTGSYEKDGQKVYTTDIVGEKITFMGVKKTESEKEPEPVKEEPKEMDPFEEFGNEIAVSESDLPF